MSIDAAVLRFAGVMVLLSVVLTVYVSPLFVWFTVFIGLNLLQSSFTGFCPAAMAFRALRLRQAGDATRFKIVYLGPVHTSINPRFVAQGAPPRGVAAPEAVARHLANVVLSKKRSVFYYPWTTGLVCRFGAWMPDGFFERLTRPLRR